jgi:hypothetical protein
MAIRLHIVRLMGVAYVGALSFLLTFLLSHWLDKITPEIDKKQSKWRILLSVILQFGLIGALMYLTRGLIKKIPFPLEGTAGYIHSQLSELRSLPLIVFIFMFYQTKTQEKMKYLIETQSLIPTANLQVPL